MSCGGLAQRLRDDTAHLHREAERSPFMAALLAGRCDHVAYCLLLQHLCPVYAALEDSLPRAAHHPWLRGFWSPALRRLPALQADLACLQDLQGMSDGGLAGAVPPAVRSYATRIAALVPAASTTVSDTAAAQLLAHAYVRYLGDLSGGQILRRIVRHSLGLTGAAGTAFYDFGEPAQATALARQMREALQALPDSGAAADAAVSEARWCFDQHLRLFEALDTLTRRH